MKDFFMCALSADVLRNIKQQKRYWTYFEMPSNVASLQVRLLSEFTPY